MGQKVGIFAGFGSLASSEWMPPKPGSSRRAPLQPFQNPSQDTGLILRKHPERPNSTPDLLPVSSLSCPHGTRGLSCSFPRFFPLPPSLPRFLGLGFLVDKVQLLASLQWVLHLFWFLLLSNWTPRKESMVLLKPLVAETGSLQPGPSWGAGSLHLHPLFLEALFCRLWRVYIF